MTGMGATATVYVGWRWRAGGLKAASWPEAEVDMTATGQATAKVIYHPMPCNEITVVALPASPCQHSNDGQVNFRPSIMATCSITTFGQHQT